jgi:hypothetical protein
MGSPIYDILNKAWKSTARVLFGDELGELEDYEDWLLSGMRKLRFEKSALSGKEVSLAMPEYTPNARFLSFDEMDFGKKFEPLGINEVKDIDSVLEAISERVYYTGNIVLGESKYVERSSNIVDSHFVYCSNVVSDSKYIAYSREARLCEYCFGFFVGGECSYTVKCWGGKMKRCFECYHSESNSDSYYCLGIQNCRDCMFCFGLQNGSYAIGNLALPAERYKGIKQKLLSELVEKLKKEKSIFSLLDIVEQAKEHEESSLHLPLPPQKQFKKEVVEGAFSRTSGILLGKSLSGIDSYAGFLQKHVPKNVILKSPLSGKRVLVAGFRSYVLDMFGVEGRTVDMEELWEIGKTHVGEKEALSLKMDEGYLAKALSPVAYIAFDVGYGNISNIADAAVAINCQDCYNGSAFVNAKKCAYCYWPRESEHIFGSSVTWMSAFCMKCYYSKRLTRAFECDACDSCSDIYFSHNCENVRDSMFCFNVKNLNYAIGNAALAPDKYKQVKAKLLEQVAGELEKKKDLKWDIFKLSEK